MGEERLGPRPEALHRLHAQGSRLRASPQQSATVRNSLRRPTAAHDHLTQPTTGRRSLTQPTTVQRNPTHERTPHTSYGHAHTPHNHPANSPSLSANRAMCSSTSSVVSTHHLAQRQQNDAPTKLTHHAHAKRRPTRRQNGVSHIGDGTSHALHGECSTNQ